MCLLNMLNVNIHMVLDGVIRGNTGIGKCLLCHVISGSTGIIGKGTLCHVIRGNTGRGKSTLYHVILSMHDRRRTL